MKIYISTYHGLPGWLPEKFFTIFLGDPHYDSNRLLESIRTHIVKEDVFFNHATITPGVLYQVLNNVPKYHNVLIVTSNDSSAYIERFKKELPDFEFDDLDNYSSGSISEILNAHTPAKLEAIFNMLPDGRIGSKFPGHTSDLIVRYKPDMGFFKGETYGNIVIMGSGTFDSMERVPLYGRINIVITRNIYKYRNIEQTPAAISPNYKNVYFVKCPEDAVLLASRIVVEQPRKRILVIGGAATLQYMWQFIDTFYITQTNYEPKSNFEPVIIPQELLSQLCVESMQSKTYTGNVYVEGRPVWVEDMRYTFMKCHRREPSSEK